MSKLLVVFGATGQQGGSVIDFVLKDPQLSQQYKLRAITRNKDSNSSQKLASNGIEVVEADPTNPESLKRAFQGAHTAFVMTFPDFNPASPSEFDQGKSLVDAAVAEGVDYFIFSTLPYINKISNGKYTKVFGFDNKARAEEYIRQQPIRSSFFSPGSFMQNYQSIMKPRPSQNGDGSFVMARHVSPQTKLPMIDIVSDTGKWIGAILADPAASEGKVISAATKLYSLDEQAEILSKATGKVVRYQQVPEEVFRKFIPNEMYADLLIEMMLYQQDIGYYGPDTEHLVKEGAAFAKGKVTTFEEYLEKNPVEL